jgi:hypothetical protein
LPLGELLKTPPNASSSSSHASYELLIVDELGLVPLRLQDRAVSRDELICHCCLLGFYQLLWGTVERLFG